MTDDLSVTPAQYAAYRHWLIAAGSLEAHLAQTLAAEGLATSEYRTLVVLDESPNKRLRMSDLASVSLQSPSRSSHTITRLEAKGWVNRRPDEDDRRVIYVGLTARGEAVLARAEPRYRAAVREAFIDPVGTDFIAELDLAMRRVVAATANASVRLG